MRVSNNDEYIENIIKKIQAGDRRTAARFMTECEKSYDFLKRAASYIFPVTGNVNYVGVSGAFGAGKSTLIDGLIKVARREGLKVGVVAVDPESPFTGGALLGDRIRMKPHFLDKGVFIRSLSSGGESVCPEVLIISRILELWGADIVFIETAGVGQTQTEVLSVSDLVMLLLQPQTGDEIQLMKAGIMEMADIIVITKSDILEPHSLKSALMAEMGDIAIDYKHISCCENEEKIDKNNKKIKILETGLNMPESYGILFDEIKRVAPAAKNKNFKKTVEWLLLKKIKDEFIDKQLTDNFIKENLDEQADPFHMADEFFNYIFKGRES